MVSNSAVSRTLEKRRAVAEMSKRVESEKDQLRNSPFPKPPLAIVAINDLLEGQLVDHEVHFLAATLCLNDCVAGGTEEIAAPPKRVK